MNILKNGRLAMRSIKWDIGVNFEVVANSEQEAEQLIALEIHRMLHKRGLQEVVDFDFIEFVSGEEEDTDS